MLIDYDPSLLLTIGPRLCPLLLYLRAGTVLSDYLKSHYLFSLLRQEDLQKELIDQNFSEPKFQNLSDLSLLHFISNPSSVQLLHSPSKMAKQKLVIKLSLEDARKRSKAMKIAVGAPGVTSASVDGDKLTVAGDGVDPVALTTCLRRKLGHADLVSVSGADEKKKEGEKGGKMETMANAQPVVWPYHVTMPPPSTYHYDARYANYDPNCSIM